jgi:hypothetical protein
MDDLKRVHERELVGRDVLRKRGIVHDETDSGVRQKEPEDILSNQFRQFAGQSGVTPSFFAGNEQEKALTPPFRN